MSDFVPRLMAESERYLALLEKLGKKLVDTMDADINEFGTPSRDWNRSATNYGQGLRGLLAEQRERQKLLAGNKDELTEEEYQQGLAELQLEQLQQAPEDIVSAELARRGLKVEHIEDRED
jgi:hypothetical protein